ncbi:hypothetical protein BDV3_001322 [Batrachochytrium dendrobatidis]|nr:hypothetical protein QVD99_005555 [Batrachochytrium dendrobatidis]OAJ36705.1 hypothetical protein BDEG_20849 [Batrachochytrium dendrobatidis JEL423]
MADPDNQSSRHVTDSTHTYALALSKAPERVADDRLVDKVLKDELLDTFKTDDMCEDGVIRKDDDPVPPDCGYSWVIMIVSLFTHFVTIGLPTSYGVFQQAYKEEPEFAKSSNLEIAFVGSLGAAGMPIFSILAGRLVDKYGPRIVCACGALIVLVSLIIASFSNATWHLLITHGFLFGLGSSIAYLPGLAVLSDWWVKRRGFATGVAVAGTGIGGLTWGPILRALITHIGWRWTLRTVAMCGSAILLVCAFLLRTRVKRVARKSIDLSYFKNTVFIRLYFVTFFNSFAYFIPFFFISLYAVSHGMTREQGALLIGILNGASGIGRVALGFSGDYAGRINTLTASVAIAGLAIVTIWPVAKTFGAILGLAILFGFFIGGYVALLPTVVAQLLGANGDIATITGMVYNGLMWGNLFGSPIAGAMIDRFTTISANGSKHTNFLPSIMFSGCCLFASAMFLLSVKMSAGRMKFWVKV